jgi:hypothetical protein
VTTGSLEVLVEEPSAKRFLDGILPRMVPSDIGVQIHAFNGKSDILRKLPQRLSGYRYYEPGPKILVLVDRDDEDCRDVKRKLEKRKLEKIVAESGFLSKVAAAESAGDFDVCTRVVIEELEAWMLGDHDALIAAFPKLRPWGVLVACSPLGSIVLDAAPDARSRTTHDPGSVLHSRSLGRLLRRCVPRHPGGSCMGRRDG